jgi:hypothetical protein
MRKLQMKMLAGAVSLSIAFMFGIGMLCGGIIKLNNLPAGATTYHFGDWDFQECVFSEGERNVYGYEICGYNGSENNLVIPAVIDGHDILRIGDNAFRHDPFHNTGIPGAGDKSFLESVEISDGIMFIGLQAFFGLPNLASVTLPASSLEIIEMNAFRECHALTEIEIPNSVYRIDQAAFYSCGSLETVSFYGDVITLGANSFQACFNLKNVNFYGSLIEIGFAAFAYCESLERIVIPSTVTRIGDYAFDGCDSLTEIIFDCGTQDELDNLLAGLNVNWEKVFGEARDLEEITINFNDSPTPPPPEGGNEGDDNTGDGGTNPPTPPTGGNETYTTVEQPSKAAPIGLIIAGIILSLLAIGGAGAGFYFYKKHLNNAVR